ncbi:LysR family transcriptional regulator [Paroceanicella profunda]|uniref:LysR family transcriptional regulator n=1 Tax=Paroceanicella profunda TaxID=2579971 RepID=A0A5B8FVM4_9RHOB|nr:LysR family transcriptional regulator [Paroceanicella profunda]QDL92485.1 LysR family transcriptional regulator [Paroceanicella profunda]
MDRFLLMQCFARTAEMGSFSAAARDLGLSQPNVSRYVAALESHLHRRLLQRSTRKLHLTPEGERYYAEARRILDAVAEAESSLRSEVAPAGLLRVACPTALAHEFVMPLVPSFLRANPDLELDLQISDRFVNLIDEGAELALRIGELSDSALRARRIGVFKRVCVAETGYIAARGTPHTPEDLGQHDCIVYSLLSTGAVWRFSRIEVPVSGRLRVNSPQAVREAALAGLGVALGPSWLFEDGLRTGRLRRVLRGYEAPPVPIHMLYVANRLLPRRAVAFMDFIADAFSRVEALNATA